MFVRGFDSDREPLVLYSELTKKVGEVLIHVVFAIHHYPDSVDYRLIK